jgi:universal stress protein E
MEKLRNILCVVSPAEESSTTLRRAITLADNSQAKLTIMELVAPVTSGTGMAAGEYFARRQRALRSFVAAQGSKAPVEYSVRSGTGFLEIIRQVLRGGHDLVVKLAESPLRMTRRFRSDDMQLLRQCPCPVLLTQPAVASNFRRILAAVDLESAASEPAEESIAAQIIELSTSLALSDFAELHFVHAWEAAGLIKVRAFTEETAAVADAHVDGIRAGRQKRLDAFRERVEGSLGPEGSKFLTPRYRLVQGSAAVVIPDLANELGVDLVIMGTVGRTGIPGFVIGNTAETILGDLGCSVLAVKPAGFVTAVTLQ